MYVNLKSILASGAAALLISGVAVAQTEPPPATSEQQALPTEQAPPAAAPAAEPAMEQTGDSAISEKVKAALQADPSLQGAEIAIETMNGEVQLNGYVGNPADVDKATAIAGSVEGVTNVKNNLQPK